GPAQHLSINESSRFGERFALTVLLALMGVALFVTPVYACGGISEEKERRTLDFLLATDLSAREIVFGKFLGRVLLLLTVLSAGLPVLGLALLLGGVDPEFLLAGFGLVLTTAALTAAVSVAAACYARDLRGALLRAYGI